MSASLGIHGDPTSLGPGSHAVQRGQERDSSLRGMEAPCPRPAQTPLGEMDVREGGRGPCAAPSKAPPPPAWPTCCLASIGRRMSATCRDSRFHRSSLSLWHCCRTRISISSTCGRRGLSLLPTHHPIPRGVGQQDQAS